jgi:hypothetical protein
MSSSSLEVPRRQRPAKRSKLWRIFIILATVGVAVGWAVWFVRTPGDLPTENRFAEGTGVVDQEVYVGMLAVGDDFDRTLRISEISVDVRPDDDVEVTPLICRHGSVSVTSDADSYCAALDDPDGADFSDGDSIVLAVSASAATEVEIGQIEISFREGIKWGTKAAGLEGATLTFAEHTPGTVEDDTEPDDTTSERPGQDDPADEDDKKKDKKKQKDPQGDDA